MSIAKIDIKLTVDYDASVGIEAIREYLKNSFEEGKELTTVWQDSEFTIIKSKVKVVNDGMD